MPNKKTLVRRHITRRTTLRHRRHEALLTRVFLVRMKTKFVPPCAIMGLGG
jgi:hypothetical protein